MARRIPSGSGVWLLAALLTSCARDPSLPSHMPAAGRTLRGKITDPEGDATRSPDVAVEPDLRTVTMTVTPRGASGVIALSIRLTPGTFDPKTTHIAVAIGLDQEVTASPFGDLGGDFHVAMGPRPSFGPTAVIWRNVSPESSLRIGHAPVDVRPDGMDVLIPWSLFGTDDGRLTFRAVARSEFARGGLTGALDFAPNRGDASGVTK